ncbi:hypothetical protein FISHEDRAFT_64668 [Fistulina hepatica ATCC 64428]|uniref:Zn(2)-C6 fungal-type domain-containing protein n=1 Tax=Fistulina hepatica ATCC 64428 TaxID=1128425 RepID=A0A0D7AG88_9AGAR|nr:hypothetical protein FISHEDRAFT_64668 [Fistulina hepatica ATCC 64428]
MAESSQWHDSDVSDDGHNTDVQSAAARKRSSRACDQCRKTKSKCERSPDNPKQCKSCALASTGPSYKRGPPKGYIHAIEQRWHQVESLLGSILQCPDPRVQSVVTDLRGDDLAREILERVDSGPYGPSGRRSQPESATKEDIFASILKSNESSTKREASRSRRQSRVSREIVSSNQDRGLSVVPTQEWQDRLSERLALSPSAAPSSSTSTPAFDGAGNRMLQRRRLNRGVPPDIDWNNMYTIEPSEPDDRDAVSDAAETMGELSLDEQSEVRYHGKASGLHLLSRNDRTDDRIEGGIWKLPMARVWPPSKDQAKLLASQEEDVAVDLPPLATQEHLLGLYFTYIHPIFPAVHQSRFLSEYNAQSFHGSPKPESSQKVTPLLLLSIFAISARFDEDKNAPRDKMWEAGCEYAESARTILTRIFHRSRPSTVQSLLLLGYREFGLGSQEQGWIYIGMAIRMAVDLGINRDSGSWKIHGHKLFAPEETQTRRQIWWTCCLADSNVSLNSANALAYFNKRLGDCPYFPQTWHLKEEEAQSWQPVSSDPISLVYKPVPGRVMSGFCATCRLNLILGNIVTFIYPVRSLAGSPSRSTLEELENALHRWYVDLPVSLQFDIADKRSSSVPPPHILVLHLRYWGAVLLLHRAFIPNWKEYALHLFSVRKQSLTVSMPLSEIATPVTVYQEKFTLRRTSPFLTSYLLNAGVRPSNLQALLGLRQCLACLKDLEVVWPSAARAWDLLKGVKLGFDNVMSPNAPRAFPNSRTRDTPPDRKRDANDAFGLEKSSDFLQREAFGGSNNAFGPQQSSVSQQPNNNGVQDLSTRIMAHMLGLDIPGIEPSTSFYPGYEWWPRGMQERSQFPAPSPATSNRRQSMTMKPLVSRKLSEVQCKFRPILR